VPSAFAPLTPAKSLSATLSENCPNLNSTHSFF